LLDPEKPFSNPNHDDCVNALNCPSETWANPSTKNCERCHNLEYFVKTDHSSCVAAKPECGNGNAIIEGKQCQNCEIIDPSRPYTTLNHDGCVSSANCSSETWANPSTKNCQICANSSYFATVDHSTCISTEFNCGNGNIAVNGKQCLNCSRLNYSKPLANIAHNNCVEAENCGEGTRADISTRQCFPCQPQEFTSIDYTSCLQKCPSGTSENGRRCTAIKCPVSCSKCLGTEETSCIECRTGFIL